MIPQGRRWLHLGRAIAVEERDIGRGSAGSEKRYVTVAGREVTSAVFVAALGTLEGVAKNPKSDVSCRGGA